jgi:hypothetical protein
MPNFRAFLIGLFSSIPHDAGTGQVSVYQSQSGSPRPIMLVLELSGPRGTFSVSFPSSADVRP